MATTNISVELFSEIINKNDYHLRIWINWADFQLRLKTCGVIARYSSGSDIIHEIIDGVLTGRINWDHQRVPNINTFMHYQVRGHISNLIKKETKYLPLSNADSFQSQSTDEFNFDYDASDIRRHLTSELEKDVIAFFVYEETVSGYQSAESAKNLGLKIEEVENAKKRIRKIVRKIMKE